MTLGEGAAAMVLESLEHASARGARILGEIVGYGTTTDAVDLTKPSAADAELAISKALKDSSETLGSNYLDALQPIMVSSHGTGTKLNDAAESRAIRQALSGMEYKVIATKSAHGHLIGAAGILEFLLAIRCANDGFAPAIRNFQTEADDCILPLVTGNNFEYAAKSIVSNSFAFGGLNVSLVAIPAGEPTGKAFSYA